MFAVGDIVELYSPQAGHKKYHVCVCVNAGAAHQFLYLNSDPTFEGTIAFDCDRIPCLPASDTGKSVVTFSHLPRYNDRQLKLYKAKKLGVLSVSVAKETLEFAAAVKTLTTADRAVVSAGLKAIIGEPSASNCPSTDAKPDA